MLSFVKKFSENVKKSPNIPLFFDDVNTKGVSYAKIDEISAKVYNYLSSKGIGKEDFVLIKLPRGVQPILALVGVWKAGAACTIVEDNYAEERVKFIKEDCNCKIEINTKVWDEILKLDPKEGYVEADLHDACFAIYTSGTTGNPKGVLHEYGDIPRCVQSVMISKDEALVSKDEHAALVAPLNFIASMLFIIYVLYNGIELGKPKLYIVSYTVLKNPIALKKFMLEKTISLTFLTPSYLRMLKGSTGPFLKTIIVGSEPANNVYIKNVKAVNTYTMSETCFLVSMFKIDKSYETCPIGKPPFDLEVKLLDEDGNEVKDGEVGEICVDNPYFRGYINLEEETKKAKAYGLYHTGDLARVDSNGNYVLLGRNNDMIKINGNRIEPAEIEAAVKQVLGVSWVAARGFNEVNQSYICAYYKDDVTFDIDKVREELLKRLPYYMLPAYFMKVDEIPLKATGKLDRKALPIPDTKDFKSNYVEPTNELEKVLCDSFEKVLGIDRVGIKDDFYEMGGDSLKAIEVVVETKLPGINVSHIFRGRCAEEIAKLYNESVVNDDGISIDKKNEESMKLPHPLTTEQLYMVDYQLYTPKSTMYNLFTMLKVDTSLYDMNELVEAIYKVFKNHPALLTTFHFNEDGDLVQKYSPEVLEEIRVEHVSEFEFSQIKDNLVMPFKLINSKLYRCRVFQTEKAGYVFIDIHHSLFDGTSFKILMANMVKAYMGMELDKDYYYYILDKREKEKDSDFYNEARKYYENKYDDVEWSIKPKIDFESRENEMGELFSKLNIEDMEMSLIEKNFKISRNEFFITVALLAIAEYNKKDNVKITWIYNGRDDLNAMNSVGLLFRDLPVGLKLTDKLTIRELYRDVHEQVQSAIKYCCYPYEDLDAEVVSEDGACLLYQQDIRDGGDLEDMNIEMIHVRQNQAASQALLDIQILDGEDGLETMIDYAASRYKKESVEKFKDIFVRITQLLLHHTTQNDITVKEIREKIKGNNSIFKIVTSIFSRKG